MISGTSPDSRLVDSSAPPAGAPYSVATQAHPELKVAADRADPLFVGLVDAALDDAWPPGSVDAKS